MRTAYRLICLMSALLLIANQHTVVAETEQIDLKALAKKARPAVMLLVISDAAGKEVATGTGFLVSSDGKLITNYHVIEGGASAVAKAESGGLFPVEGVLASDPKNDLALLKIKAKDMPFLRLGNSKDIEIGTRVAVIGSPLGLEGTLSEGIVSAVREMMGDNKLLQVTAAISPGSSGSPVMNAKGEVIGIASALLRGGQALNFAVPVEFGVGLIAEVSSASPLHPFNQSGKSGGENSIYSDPDWVAALVAVSEGNSIEALKLTKALVSRYPENHKAWYALGKVYSDLNFAEDAVDSYKQTIKIKPDYFPAWYNLGILYSGSGHSDDAIAAFRQVIKIKPDSADAWHNLGAAYSQSGRHEDAIAA